MRILHIDGVGPFGGASRSLYEAMRGFGDADLSRFFLVQKGSANKFYREFADDMIVVPGLMRLDNTRASHYRGRRWLVLAREFAYLPTTIFGLIKAKWRFRDIDLIHVNEITELVPGLLAKFAFRAPLIVHCRSMQWANERSWRVRAIRSLLRKHVAAVVAIDENVRDTLPSDITIEVIHNSFDPQRMPISDHGTADEIPPMRPGSLKIGFVGNLHHGKGIIELVQAAKIVKEAGYDVEYLVVGGAANHHKGLRWRLLSTLGLAQEQLGTVERLIQEFGLEQDFHMTGPTSNIAKFIEAFDVVAFPSHFDACGRPVFEAAFFAKPAIAAVSSPKPDTLDHGRTGIAITRPDPLLLAEAMIQFASDRDLAPKMGFEAKALAEQNFSPAKNSRKLLDLYHRVTGAN